MPDRLFPRWCGALFALLPLSELLYLPADGQSVYAAALACAVCALCGTGAARLSGAVRRHALPQWSLAAAALFPLLYSGGLRKGNNMQAVFSDSTVPGNDTAPAAADENSAEQLAPDDAMDGAVPSDREAQQKSDAGKDITGGCPDGENLYTAAPAQTMDAALAHAAEALDQQGFVLTVAAREGSAVQVLLTDAAGGIGDPAVLDAAMEAEGFTAADNNWYTYKEDTNS